MKENPFLHYRLKAVELGINERDLIASILVTSSGDEEEKRLEVKCDNVLIRQDRMEIPQIYYYSEINSDRLSILVCEHLIINRKKGKREFDSIEKLFNPDYSFAISGQHPKGSHDYISIKVSGSKRIKSSIKLDKIKKIPEEFFNPKINYQPALFWMLEQYAKGLK